MGIRPFLRRQAAVLCPLLVAVAGGSAALEAPRSVEILSQRCTSELAHKEITLFASGTLRQRESVEDERSLRLVELAPDELAPIVSRLRELDLREVESARGGAAGEWVGQCSITLSLDDERPRFFRYGSLDVLPLALQRLRLLLSELDEMVDERSGRVGLPAAYQPRAGDLLVREDGSVFEVVGFTVDGRGIELTGIDQPVTLYVAVEEFRRMFVEHVGESFLDLER